MSENKPKKESRVCCMWSGKVFSFLFSFSALLFLEMKWHRIGMQKKRGEKWAQKEYNLHHKHSHISWPLSMIADVVTFLLIVILCLFTQIDLISLLKRRRLNFRRQRWWWRQSPHLRTFVPTAILVSLCGLLTTRTRIIYFSLVPHNSILNLWRRSRQ